MRRARRFPQRLVRWTSLCACFALTLYVSSFIVITTFGLRHTQASSGSIIGHGQSHGVGAGPYTGVTGTAVQFNVNRSRHRPD